MKRGPVWKDKLWILTAPVHSGKTGYLNNWVKNRDVSGFLTPDVDGLRVLYDLSNKKTIPFEVRHEVNENIISVGKYSFLMSAFDYGNSLINGSVAQETDYFILDEAGKLEMQGLGFAEGIEFLLDHLRNNDSKTIYIIVVRDYLLSPFLEKYGLKIDSWEELD